MRFPSSSARKGSVALPRVVGLLGLATGLLGLLSSCDKDSEPVTVASPAKITVPQRALSPEGIQYDAANQRFIVSSRTGYRKLELADLILY